MPGARIVVHRQYVRDHLTEVRADQGVASTFCSHFVVSKVLLLKSGCSSLVYKGGSVFAFHKLSN